MKLDLLLNGIVESIGQLMVMKKYPNDHEPINNFQEELTRWLEANAKTTHNWTKEKVTTYRKENDSIDIYGKPSINNENEWIIEIDATRADQVAKKMLSRFALWGLKRFKKDGKLIPKPITYIAILYPDTQEGRNQSKKFINFGYEVIHKINKDSRVIGIILGTDQKERSKSKDPKGPIDPKDPRNWIVDEKYIEVFDPSKDIHCKIVYGQQSNMDVENMGECAKTAIQMYANNSDNNTTYDELKLLFDRYISDQEGPSRYNDAGTLSSDNVKLFTYSQFRRYDGSWLDFVALCGDTRIGVQIKELVCCFTKNEGLNYYGKLEPYY